MRAILLGAFAAFFFAFTFVLNRSMELSGGSWIWSASLRYIFMVPLLLIIVMAKNNLVPLLKVMREQLGTWMLWSFVGFGLFYAPLCFASAYSPGWLIAGTWQITIISGSLLAPFFSEIIQTKNGPLKVRGKIPLKGLMMSLVILLGIILMQIEQSKDISLTDLLYGIIPVIIASFAYPLGNRKMMEICAGRLDAYQRVLGMTLASLPLWFVLSLYGFFNVGAPSKVQTVQAILVAVFSGVIATVLFFKATDMVRGNMQKLASIEATQSMEVLFALIGELIFLSIQVPSPIAWSGMFVVILGMILHSYVTHNKKEIRRER
ncbi:multidrug resistance efflux transporter family protein [Paenibacillus sp. SYP-B3998]|uniref:Multidrug resistance efflux transporter family protein n=1 Tax=Paenibacillus sp. SYP-B3998 TaxID=2678564 RepID=A0A6G3ZXV3_9BACL|nr:multidrug resistance efflux transporter family protein [Paenibacillus sp. SYP-B3998]NEW06878.1 multidrug resistance efflux transporter family protein [Paenibacillus sp. SYP-B3998]